MLSEVMRQLETIEKKVDETCGEDGGNKNN